MTHFFTPEEANKKLPELKRMVEEIVSLKKSLDEAYAADGNLPIKRSRIVNQISELVGKLEESGIQMKDLDSGLVDFPAVRYGETVLLCWKLGEDEVLYWHGLAEGFRGRKSLKPELAKIR